MAEQGRGGVLRDRAGWVTLGVRWGKGASGPEPVRGVVHIGRGVIGVVHIGRGVVGVVHIGRGVTWVVHIGGVRGIHVGAASYWLRPTVTLLRKQHLLIF